jgi:membrane protein YqaA with SNARE-associated domain
MIELSVYATLFAVALLAATVLPLQSEALLVGLLLTGDYPVAALLVTASLVRERRWFPVGETQLARARTWYHRWGRWSLLLSWAPVIGDPLTVAAGVLREPFWSFLLIAGGAKVLRYLALIAATLGWLA